MTIAHWGLAALIWLGLVFLIALRGYAQFRNDQYDDEIAPPSEGKQVMRLLEGVRGDLNWLAVLLSALIAIISVKASQ